VNQPSSSISGGSPVSLAQEDTRRLALESGFTEAGLVALPHVHEDRDAGRFAEWIRAGRAGTMRYLERVTEDGSLVREKVRIPFAWAQSAIVCFANYNSPAPRSTEPVDKGSGWIARYAWSSRTDAEGVQRPSDYHRVLKKRLDLLESKIHAAAGDFEARGYVDTGPVVERSLAVAAGLGWTGKNTCLIHPELGSYGFLAVLLTSLPVEAKTARLTPDRCGTCTRCLEACPTGALDEPYRMDATRCISYLTIEHKGPIDEELMSGMGRQIFGCDICQDVCPWNRKAPISADSDLAVRSELVNPSLEELAQMDEAAFERRFNGSPVRRAGFEGLRRNLAIAMGNSGLRRFEPTLRSWSEAAEEGTRKAAQWALTRLREGRSQD
jgi:epoxyqueuosine reductase